jgi:hypothetical protein
MRWPGFFLLVARCDPAGSNYLFQQSSCLFPGNPDPGRERHVVTNRLVCLYQPPFRARSSRSETIRQTLPSSRSS